MENNNDKTKLTIKIVFKPGCSSNWTEWYGCHDFKITNDVSDNLVSFWNNNDDGDKVEKIIPLSIIERIYKIHVKSDD